MKKAGNDQTIGLHNRLALFPWKEMKAEVISLLISLNEFVMLAH